MIVRSRQAAGHKQLHWFVAPNGNVPQSRAKTRHFWSSPSNSPQIGTYRINPVC
ncbi:hypothetical protein B0H10DRAFT_2041441, partial [Mycena sp. CBHHK59/15]